MLWVVVVLDECLRYICAGAPTRVALQLLENAYFNWDFPMGLRVSQVPAFFLEFANQWNCLSNGVLQNNGLKIWNDLNNEQRIGNFRQCMACASRASVAQSSSEKLSVLSSRELQQPTHISPSLLFLTQPLPDTICFLQWGLFSVLSSSVLWLLYLRAHRYNFSLQNQDISATWKILD